MKGKIKIGKVNNYNDYIESGTIIDKEGKEFVFLKNDLNDDITKDDIVQFRGDQVGDEYRAYFVKKVDFTKILDVDEYLETRNNLKGKILYR